MTTFFGLNLPIDIDFIIYKLLPFEGNNNYLNQSSHEKFMPLNIFPIEIDHHNSRGCHTNPCYSWKRGSPYGNYEEDYRRFELQLILRVEWVKFNLHLAIGFCYNQVIRKKKGSIPFECILFHR